MNSLVLNELKKRIPKDKKRKVCKQCHELGHSINSIECKINIEMKNKYRDKIKQYILSKNCLDETTLEEHLNILSLELCISLNHCKTLYNEISMDEFLYRNIDLTSYLRTMKKTHKLCYDCNKELFFIQSNTHRIWKQNDLCDHCWCRYKEERDILWEKIKQYKSIQCSICCKVQQYSGESFHYDHLNMFYKKKSICSMVNEGICIEDIYSEIDKCQILCLSCHHIVTDIERKLVFTRIKQSMTRGLNIGEINEKEYDEQVRHYQSIYEAKMKTIYEDLRQYWALNQSM